MQSDGLDEDWRVVVFSGQCNISLPAALRCAGGKTARWLTRRRQSSQKPRSLVWRSLGSFGREASKWVYYFFINKEESVCLSVCVNALNDLTGGRSADPPTDTKHGVKIPWDTRVTPLSLVNTLTLKIIEANNNKHTTRWQSSAVFSHDSPSQPVKVALEAHNNYTWSAGKPKHGWERNVLGSIPFRFIYLISPCYNRLHWLGHLPLTSLNSCCDFGNCLMTLSLSLSLSLCPSPPPPPHLPFPPN